MWSITWPRNGRLVASVTASPRNSPRARRPGWRAMKRRTPFSVGSSSAPICTPSCGSVAERGRERVRVAGAQPAQRDAVALEALREREDGTGREPNGDGIVRAHAPRPSSSPSSPSWAAAATRARTRTSRRASSRSRSSTRRSRGCSTSPRTSSSSSGAQRRSDETLRNVAVTVETKPRGRGRRARVRPATSRGAGLSRRRTADLGARRGPDGRRRRHVNTWSAGPAGARRGEGADLEARAGQGRHVRDRLPRRPRPHGQGAAPPRASTSGTLHRRRSPTSPSPPAWASDGEVERGVEAGSS